MADPQGYLAAPRLDFSLTPEEIQAQWETVKTRTDTELQALADLPPGSRTFANTFVVFDRLLAEMQTDLTAAIFLKSVSSDAAVRQAGHEVETKAEEYEVGIWTRLDLFEVLRDTAATDPQEDPVDARLSERMLERFERNGLGLDEANRARVRELKTKLVGLEAEYGKALNEVTDKVGIAADEVEGLGEDYLAMLETTESGGYLVSMDSPQYVPFMHNGRSRAARQRLEKCYNSRCAVENVPLLEQATALRDEIARLLGYPTHSHYVLADRMAQDPEKVDAFLTDLFAKLEAKGAQELATLLGLLQADEPGATEITDYDWAYYDNQDKKTRFDLDPEVVKEFFPYEHVTAALFEIYQTLLGVRFEEVSDGHTWHPDARMFKVFEASGGELLCHFFVDQFPREGKYKHAAAFDLLPSFLQADGTSCRPVAAMVCNFSPPGAGKPALLKHREVETYFHEFGHIMHQVLTKSRYAFFSGTNVAYDFVEAPSQMLQNWVWDKDILKRLSRHWESGEPLPDEMIGRIIAAKNHNNAMFYLRQMFFARFDQDIHSRAETDTVAKWAELKFSIRGIPMSPGTAPTGAFGHLMGGYDSGYYGYLWSEVYASDMFTRFEQEGILSTEAGKEYRKWILEPGGSMEAMDLIRRFLGREPNQEAFLRHTGIAG